MFRRYPLTIILKREVEKPQTPDLALKFDPGSKTTGIAIVNQTSGEVVFAANLEHRGNTIKASMDSRRLVRKHRRARNTRYRRPRFLHRTKPSGWLPPSMRSRVSNIDTWGRRLRTVYPIRSLSVELVKFDTQLMVNPEISGIEYNQGELAGYEIREYLLEKWNRECAYCGKRNVPLQVEHIHPRCLGGGKRVSNLTLACEDCNQTKGARDVRNFLANDPVRLARVLAQAKRPLKDAGTVNHLR